ncbi:MAG: hypothetical protein HY909_29580 [Deltaproteobacteria bacterium]|nr:hypothetical protein [Deltaproteobacteria bacterium]
MTTLRRAVWATGCAVLCLPVLVPATVEEQRARLPPPATCQDPVEGLWKAHRYDPRFQDWSIFTLSIRRSAPESPSLVGYITIEYWTGRPTESIPPPCRPGLRFYILDQPSRGTFTAARNHVEFWGLSYRVREERCPRSFSAYNLDHFAGAIDPRIQEFQTVNNDGGRDNNEPYVFRRVQCVDTPVPHPAVTPPPFHPRVRQGCSPR